MPKIDREHKNYLTPEIWKEMHLTACLRKNRPVILDQKINFPYILGY